MYQKTCFYIKTQEHLTIYKMNEDYHSCRKLSIPEHKYACNGLSKQKTIGIECSACFHCLCKYIVYNPDIRFFPVYKWISNEI